PVDGEVPPALLSALDELPAQPGAGRLRRDGLGLEDLEVPGDPLDRSATLEEVVETAVAADIVVGQIELGDPRVAQRQPVLGAVALDETPLDHPVDLPLDQGQIVGLDRLEGALPQVEGPLDDRGVQLASLDEVVRP